jgi:hypothetical protein
LTSEYARAKERMEPHFDNTHPHTAPRRHRLKPHSENYFRTSGTVIFVDGERRHDAVPTNRTTLIHSHRHAGRSTAATMTTGPASTRGTRTHPDAPRHHPFKFRAN